MSHPWIVDAINSKYFGHKIGEKQLDNGRIQIKARLVAFKPTSRGKPTWLDYELDPSRDIIKTRSVTMNKPVWILVNRSGIPGVDHEHSDYAKLVDETGDVQDLASKVERLRNKLGAKDKKIDRLERKLEEPDSEDNGSSQKYPCNVCGTEWAESTWRQNNGECSDDSCNGFMEQFI